MGMSIDFERVLGMTGLTLSMLYILTIILH